MRTYSEIEDVLLRARFVKSTEGPLQEGFTIQHVRDHHVVMWRSLLEPQDVQATRTAMLNSYKQVLERHGFTIRKRGNMMEVR